MGDRLPHPPGHTDDADFDHFFALHADRSAPWQSQARLSNGEIAPLISAHPEEGLSLSKARLEGRTMVALLRDATSTSSVAPQDERVD
jgi:hypothetical protein